MAAILNEVMLTSNIADSNKKAFFKCLFVTYLNIGAYYGNSGQKNIAISNRVLTEITMLVKTVATLFETEKQDRDEIFKFISQYALAEHNYFLSKKICHLLFTDLAYLRENDDLALLSLEKIDPETLINIADDLSSDEYFSNHAELAQKIYLHVFNKTNSFQKDILDKLSALINKGANPIYIEIIGISSAILESFNYALWPAIINILEACALKGDKNCLQQLNNFYRMLFDEDADLIEVQDLKETLYKKHITLLQNSEPNQDIQKKQQWELSAKIINLVLNKNFSIPGNIHTLYNTMQQIHTFNNQLDSLSSQLEKTDIDIQPQENSTTLAKLASMFSSVINSSKLTKPDETKELCDFTKKLNTAITEYLTYFIPVAFEMSHSTVTIKSISDISAVIDGYLQWKPMQASTGQTNETVKELYQILENLRNTIKLLGFENNNKQVFDKSLVAKFQIS